MAGKMLRLNPDGTVPSDNPRAGSPIIAYGIRNSFGFTFDPQNGRLWETENGPDCNDEINLIARLRLENFGWGPSADVQLAAPGAAQHQPGRAQPGGAEEVLRHATRADRRRLLPACVGSRAAASSSSATTTPGAIHRATLTSARTGIASQALFYNHPAPVLSVETPLDGGPIYFSTERNIFALKP